MKEETSEQIAKILVVDDKEENLIATRRILQKTNVDIVTAMSGNEALTKLLHEEFALILLDIQMPEMDGFEVASLIKTNDSINTPPIIFLTAIYNDSEFVNRAAELGAVDYIFKPINPNILLSKVSVYIELYSQNKLLKGVNLELKEKNDELERFAYICSHDLKEPVRIISIYSDLLKKQLSKETEIKAHNSIETISLNAKNLYKMIGDILNFSRLDKEEIKIVEVDSAQVLNDVLQKYESLISEKDAAIEFKNLPKIKYSYTLLSILFQNLLENALKFSRVNVKPKIKIEAIKSKDNWIFSVEDNGIGIEKKDTDKVFKIFQRIHNKNLYPGTGIGIGTCKKFLEYFGGNIYFESRLGEGTKFFFTIPFNK